MCACMHAHVMLSNVDVRRVAFFFSQTELTCQRIQEFETQASSDLELRNNKIDELNRVSIVVAY
jgi:hypothetical protein